MPTPPPLSFYRPDAQWCIAKNAGGYTQRGVAKGLNVPCLFMITEVSIRCQKNLEVGLRRIPAYTPPIHHCGCPSCRTTNRVKALKALMESGTCERNAKLPQYRRRPLLRRRRRRSHTAERTGAMGLSVCVSVRRHADRRKILVKTSPNILRVLPTLVAWNSHLRAAL